LPRQLSRVSRSWKPVLSSWSKKRRSARYLRK